MIELERIALLYKTVNCSQSCEIVFNILLLKFSNIFKSGKYNERLCTPHLAQTINTWSMAFHSYSHSLPCVTIFK